MKWLKHMTANWDDEKLANLVGEGGDSGLALYGAFWRMAEIVASQMDGPAPSCSVSYPVWRWVRLMSVRKSYLSSILTRLQKEGLLVLEGDPKADQTVTVKMPNLLKYRDEYSKKSRQAPDNVPPRTEGEGEGDKEVEQKKISTSARSVPPEELAGTLPLVNGKSYSVSKEQVSEWSKAFPGVLVKTELRKFKVWLDANPTRKKTERGIRRAIVGWLERAQNSSRGGNGNGKRTDYATRNLEAAADGLSGAIRVLRANRGENNGGSGSAGDCSLFSSPEDNNLADLEPKAFDLHAGPVIEGIRGGGGDSGELAYAVSGDEFDF